MTDNLIKLMITVDRFTAAMKEKLYLKAMRGWTGWDDPKEKSGIKERLRKAVDKLLAGDVMQAVDCANLSMFLLIQSSLEKNDDDA